MGDGFVASVSLHIQALMTGLKEFEKKCLNDQADAKLVPVLADTELLAPALLDTELLSPEPRL